MKTKARNCLTLLTLLISFNVIAVTFTRDVAVTQALAWMKSNPVMGAVERSVASVSTFPATGYGVYVVELAPRGYLVLNSDEALPLVVAFSADSNVNLSDLPMNAFRSMLLRHSVKMAGLLADPVELKKLMVPDVSPMAVTELHGPFMDTSWDQCNPYNKLCPSVPAGLGGYGGRAPSGCVPTAYAQIMNFHRWPLHGRGSHSYTDNSGAITGTHSAFFSDTYDWGAMLNSYAVFSSNPLDAENAVAELMYELGVAVNANYESNVTSAVTSDLGKNLDKYFYYEDCNTYSTLAALTTTLKADLRAGFPCVVSVPGHSIVADGLMVDSGVTTYHINYGWGGNNNGWWLASNVYGAALDSGVTSLRPQLLAFPVSSSFTGAVSEAVELQWMLPKQRETEADKLTIYSLEEQTTGTWSSNASELPSGNEDWTISSAGRNGGDCWYSGPSESAFMVLDEVLVPDGATTLSFYVKYIIASAVFTVSASTDGGESFTTLVSLPGDHQSSSWKLKSVPLAAYSGQQVTLCFELSSCTSYYPNGGVWIDDLSVNSGSWLDWEHFHTDATLASRRFSSTETDIDDCDDFTVFQITSTHSYMDWVSSTTEGVDDCFYKVAGGYGNVEYHLTTISTITPNAATRLLLRAKYKLYQDGFKVLVSTDNIVFTEIWAGAGTTDWGDIAIDLGTYAGQPIYVRFEYSIESYYLDGGIWIDSVSIEDVTNPELEGQPIHYTTMSPTSVGVHTLKTVLTDTNMRDHSMGPAFTLTVFDNDGMPAWWEELYGFDPFVNDSADDSDGDGFTNLEEYIAGTNPRQANSFFAIDIIGTTINWPAILDRTYRVWCAEQLAGPWQVLQTLQGPTDTFTDSSGVPKRFYKVDVAH